MAKIAWKVINGYGPYAYLQESVKTAGKVISKHLAYLGKAGTGGLFPGKHVTLPAVPGFAGGRVVVPLVTGETLADLNPKPKAAIKWMAKQVKEGLPASAITTTPPAAPKSSAAKGKGKAKPKPKAVKAKTAQPAPRAPKPQELGATTPPNWTKIGEQLGSTPGGLYEDEAGVKHYVKHPVTDKHRKNELLAMALYRLANVAVPETFATEVDGKPGVASRYIEGLTGSGANPKDLIGTKEGFAVDAWLANWDVVGVGATKYDNILELDGHAYRIDAGGALLYRGTGGPKGDLFGEEVTELEGLRDKKLNPVSETVFGDMTLQEIAGSATKVTTIPDSKIAAAVQEHFGDDPVLAQELTAKLIARRESINKQVSDQVMDHLAGQIAASGPATAMLQQKLEVQKPPAEPQQSGAADAPPAYPSLVKLADGDILKDKEGKPLVSETHIKQLTEAMDKGVAELNLVKWELTKEVEGNDKINAVLFAAEMLYKKSAADDSLKNTTAFILAASEAAQPQTVNPTLPESEVQHDVEGNPLLTPSQIRQLEEAAAQGKHALADKVNELGAASYPTNPLQFHAVLGAAAILNYQLQNPPKPQPADTSEETPTSALLDPSDILKDADGKPLVTQQHLSSLEQALAKGPVAFYELKEAMAHEAKGPAAQHAILVASYHMQENWKAQQQLLGATGVPDSPTSLLKPSDIKKDDQGNPLVTPDQLSLLESALNKGISAFTLTKGKMVDEAKDSATAMAIVHAADVMKTNWKNPLALTEAQVPKDADGKPLLNSWKLQGLEDKALLGPGPLSSEKWKMVAQANSLKEIEAWFQAEAAVYKAGYEAKIPGYAGHPVATPDVLDSATVKLDPADVPKDHTGKKSLNKLELTKLELAASESSSLLMTVSKEMQEKTKSVSKTSAISNATKKLVQLAEAAELSAPVQTAMPEVQDVAAAKGEVAGPSPMPYSLTSDEIPKDHKGNPLVSKANVKKMEEAMATGGLPSLNDVKSELTKSGKMKHSKIMATLDTADLVYKKSTAAANLKNFTDEILALPEATHPPTVKPTLQDADIFQDGQDNLVLAPGQIRQLEEAAAQGKHTLAHKVSEIAQEDGTYGFKFYAALAAGDALAVQLQYPAHQPQAVTPEPVAISVPEAAATPAAKLDETPPEPMSYKLTDNEILKDHKGKLLVTKANLKKLEEAMEKSLPDLNDAKWEIAKGIKNKTKMMAVLDTADLIYKKWAVSTYLEKVTEDMLAGQTAPQPGMATPALKDVDLPKDDNGNPLLAPEHVQQLEEAAAQGKYALAHKVNELAKEVGQQGGPQFYAVTEAADALSYQLQYPGQQPQPVVPEPVAVSVPEAAAMHGPKLTDAEIPKAMGKPLLSKDQVKVLEAAAAKGIPELEAAADQLVEHTSFQADNDAVMNAAAVLKAKMSGAEGAPAGIPAAKPKVTEVPKDNKGKPLVSKANVKKLEDAAAQPGQLDVVATGLVEKMLSPAKKAAIAAIAADLKSQLTGVEVEEADGGSGMSDTIEQVDDGEVKLPKQTVPKRDVVDQQVKLTQAGNKDYDQDLEKVSGKKGSNEGGLFKDKQLQTLHYVKWPNSTLRAKNEALAALLYEYAQVPVPTVRLIKFNDQDAVMSDWLEDAAPMTVDAMKQSQDVRRNFVFDAWLANWDVVGMSADNIVKGPGDKAYRIDLGGSLLFRAQGKPRPLDEEVKELVSLRDAGINPNAAKVFTGLTSAELKEGAERLADITDYQIDDAVDSLAFPMTSDDYSQTTYGKDAGNLPKMLKDRLKARRDYIVDDILHAEEKKAATVASLKDTVDLKPESLDEVLTVADTITWHSPHTNQKWAIVESILEKELGVKNGQAAAKALKKHYNGWKGTTNSTLGDMLRWAAGEMYSRGAVEQSRIKKFQQFMVGKKHMSADEMNKRQETLSADIKKPTAKRLVEGLDIMQEKNEVILRVQNPGKETMTVYRGWKPDQVEYLKLTNAKVGDVLDLNDPPLYSWSFTPNVAENFGHGSIVTKAQVPMDNFLLSDLANGVGKYGGENEVVFKGVPDFEMEVIKKH